MSREKILESQLESLRKLQTLEHKERLNNFLFTLEQITNGEWDEIKEMNPGLHKFIKQATNRG